jgi:hypothetical protein
LSDPEAARTRDTENTAPPTTASTTSGIHARLSTPANAIPLPRSERLWHFDT